MPRGSLSTKRVTGRELSEAGERSDPSGVWRADVAGPLRRKEVPRSRPAGAGDVSAPRGSLRKRSADRSELTTVATRRRAGRHGGAAGLEIVDLDVEPADHEVGVDRGCVEPDFLELGLACVAAAVDRLEQPSAVGDMAARVLVEERVQEDEARTSDARSPSTSATSPSIAAPSSVRICSRTTSTPQLAFTFTARPPSKRISRSRTTSPRTVNGFVDRTVPSVRRRSGVVNTSSVGTLTTCRRPSTVSSSAVDQFERGVSPTVRSVPGPRKRMQSNRRSSSSVARSTSFATCRRHASTGSGSSSRAAETTASRAAPRPARRRRPVAQPSFGKATIDQLNRR